MNEINMGRVSKWLNRRGYGFIQNISGPDYSEDSQDDLFVHITGLNVSDSEFKCLIPGEYVNFKLEKTEDGKSKCVDVTGVGGGLLLCQHPDLRFKYFPKNKRRSEEEVEDGEVEDDTGN